MRTADGGPIVRTADDTGPLWTLGYITYVTPFAMSVTCNFYEVSLHMAADAHQVRAIVENNVSIHESLRQYWT